MRKWYRDFFILWDFIRPSWCHIVHDFRCLKYISYFPRNNQEGCGQESTRAKYKFYAVAIYSDFIYIFWCLEGTPRANQGLEDIPLIPRTTSTVDGREWTGVNVSKYRSVSKVSKAAHGSHHSAQAFKSCPESHLRPVCLSDCDQLYRGLISRRPHTSRSPGSIPPSLEFIS